MAIIISIIVLVALVSLYDHFSARNWQQVTSSVRNEVVFEKRNKAYGAYAIRKDYNRRMILILAGLTGGVGAAYGAYMAAHSVPEITVRKKAIVELDTIQLDLTEKKVLPKFQRPESSAPTKSEIVKFPTLVVTDDPIDPKLKAPDENDLNGDRDQKGDERFGLPVARIDSIPTTGGKQEEIITGEEIPTIVDEDPEFPGGRKKLAEFLGQNLVYPELPREMGVQGKCWIRFVVDKEGHISDVTVSRGVDGYPEFGKESVRVVRKMPKWKPGMLNGKATKSYFDLPISFVLEKQ